MINARDEERTRLFKPSFISRATAARRHYHKGMETVSLEDIYSDDACDIKWEAFIRSTPESLAFQRSYNDGIVGQSKYIIQVDEKLPKGFKEVSLKEAIDLLTSAKTPHHQDGADIEQCYQLISSNPMSSRGLMRAFEHESRDAPPPLWIDMLSPSEEDITMMAEALGIHPLTVEDCVQSDLLSESSFEKVEQFHDYVFVVIDERFQRVNKHYTMKSSKDTAAPSTFANTINFIIFENMIISIHQEHIHTLAQVMYRLLVDEPSAFLRPDWVMYSFLDAITDKFFEFIRILREDVAQLDGQALTLNDQEKIDKHTVLKHISLARNIMNDLRLRIISKEGLIEGINKICQDSLKSIRKVAKKRAKAMWKRTPMATAEDASILPSPSSSPLMSSPHRIDGGSGGEYLRKGKGPGGGGGMREEESLPWLRHQRPRLIIQPRTVVYMRDILDHIKRMEQFLRLTAEHISTISDTYVARLSIDMTTTSNVMNASMQRFAAVATIFLPLTLVSGMWGMNIKVPGAEIESLWWFFGISIVFAIVIIVMTVVFWLKKWL